MMQAGASHPVSSKRGVSRSDPGLALFALSPYQGLPPATALRPPTNLNLQPATRALHLPSRILAAGLAPA